MTFASTMLYFQQANLVADAFSDRGVRTAFFAKIDLAVNILTLIFQVYLTARIVKWLGVGLTLAIIPLVTALRVSVRWAYTRRWRSWSWCR